MTERPILFNGAMVRAILSGAKTQTRRAMKPQPADDIAQATFPNPSAHGWRSSLRHPHGPTTAHFCPFGQPGDRLWVRERWKTHSTFDHLSPREVPPRSNIFYAADDRYSPSAARWRPSIHMPRDACRLVLEITAVRVERLQAITEADAEAEGTNPVAAKEPTHRDAFRYLWGDTGGDWESNPWVWVVGFRPLEVGRHHAASDTTKENRDGRS
ncbi:hypothetical protein CXF96_16745 [Stenotrophomonas sp. Betaine-02u-21]|uniref:hypothetical protein n=1 Tax=unclassified Stenotrophomonas TaxID=196198 RepID=UPI000C348DE9|nr:MULTISPECIES: hypothetical protein [unclassified Stenotrophomonas]PKH71833.1 hypothetical protein CXF96_16745 [Stenotrophomonas sp. Betaine-02u-21]PKH74925.1 hypothetical protein CXF90_03865 [Stenotrophomonas sp. Betaine-02u-23]PKH95873.1 hypothetical protein CXG43_11650 [Stenotrophomonas sp. Bg11-02]